MNWAWRSGIPPGPRFVLVTLADQGQDHSGEDWSCFPSIHKLVERTGYGRATVQRHLTWLWQEGWITRARRRRKDGTLGINDFILHREAEDRARLKTIRKEAEESVEIAGESEAVAGVDPCPDMRHGEADEPCPDLSPAMSQKQAEPCPNLSPQEPLVEPLDKPTGRARGREAGDEGFEAALAAYPESGRLRTDEPAARAAWAMAVQLAGDAAALSEAVRRYAAHDPDLKSGDYGARAFEKWLSGKRWRPWLAAPSAGTASAETVMPTFDGPAAIRAAFLAVADPGKVASYLDPSRYETGPPARLVARTGMAASWLRQFRDVLSEFDLVVEREVG